MRGDWLSVTQGADLLAGQLPRRPRRRAEAQDDALHGAHELLPVQAAADLRVHVIQARSAPCHACLTQTQLVLNTISCPALAKRVEEGSEEAYMKLRNRYHAKAPSITCRVERRTPRSFFRALPPSFTNSGKSSTCAWGAMHEHA